MIYRASIVIASGDAVMNTPLRISIMLKPFLAGIAFLALACAPLQAADFVDQILTLISHPDREFRAAALEKVRSSAKGADATQRITAKLADLDADGQIALIRALADRRDPAALPGIVKLTADSSNEAVRAAGLQAFGSLGSDADVPRLVAALAKGGAEQSAARTALVQLSGPTIDAALGKQLEAAAPNVRAGLIDVLAMRRAATEAPRLIAAARDDDAQVRTAAMNALGQIGRAEHVADLLPGVLKATRGGERDQAERNVALICARIDSENQRGTVLIEALQTVAPADRDELLPLVGRVGGRKLIDFVGDIASEKDPARRKFGIDALSKWPDASVADKLLSIASKSSDPAERTQAFQGYVKISATRDSRNDRQRLDRMKQAWEAARTPEEKLFVINRTRTAYAVEAVRFLLPMLDEAEFAQMACESIVEIAHHREVRDPNKAEFDKILDRVIATSRDSVVVDRAQRYKRGETWERPKK